MPRAPRRTPPFRGRRPARSACRGAIAAPDRARRSQPADARVGCATAAFASSSCAVRHVARRTRSTNPPSRHSSRRSGIEKQCSITRRPRARAWSIRERVVGRVAGVDHERLVGFASQLDLELEGAPLRVAGDAVAVVVESRLADRDATRMRGVARQQRLVEQLRVVRVAADRRVDLREGNGGRERGGARSGSVPTVTSAALPPSRVARRAPLRAARRPRDGCASRSPRSSGRAARASL